MRVSSNWRKIPVGLLKNIMEYCTAKEYYSVEDRDSRNGTFVIDCSKHNAVLEQDGFY